MKYIILLWSLLFSVHAFTQSEKTIYFDKNLGIVKKSNSLYKGIGTMNRGSFELQLYSKKDDYHILTAHYTDATLAVMDGPFISYYRNQNIENIGSYVKGKENGLWVRWNENKKIIDSIWYTSGLADSSVHYNYSDSNKLNSITRSNYADSSFITTRFDKNEKPLAPAVADTVSKEDDIVFKKTDENAEFPGGDSAMNNYFQSQFASQQYELSKNATSGGCTVKFTVDKNGRADNITTSYCDNQALLMTVRFAILKINWLPAMVNGRPVKSFKQITTAFYPALSAMLNTPEGKSYFNFLFNPSTKEKATCFGSIQNDGNLIKYTLSDVRTKNQIFSMHFTDSSLQMCNGSFISYYSSGPRRMNGDFVLGRKNGLWLQWNDKGWVVDTSVYQIGIKTSETSIAYQPDGSVMNMEIFNFSNQELRSIFFDDGEVTYDKTLHDNSSDDDSIHTKVEIDAAFPGGNQGWAHYVTQTVSKKLDNVYSSGTCVVEFIVDTTGKVSDVKALTMRGTGLARVAVNAIKKGPDWFPAQINGKKVKAFRLQPVTFNRSYY